MTVLLIILLLISIAVIIIFVLKGTSAKVEKESLKLRLEQAAVIYEQYNANLDELSGTIKALKKERSRSKSVEVRTGLIMEKMTPFMKVFNHDPKTAHFLGQPIDYIVFGEDEIVLVEVKTGKSKTTKKQNLIKKLVEEGKVRFELVRFDYE
jgi:predicted Holliday junction resolvase-like endonuclease